MGGAVLGGATTPEGPADGDEEIPARASAITEEGAEVIEVLRNGGGGFEVGEALESSED